MTPLVQDAEDALLLFFPTCYSVCTLQLTLGESATPTLHHAFSCWLPGNQCSLPLTALFFSHELWGLGPLFTPAQLVVVGNSPVDQKGVEGTEWGSVVENHDSVSHCGQVPGPCHTNESPFSRPTPRSRYLPATPHGGVHRYALGRRCPPEGSDRLDELGLRGKGTQPLPLPTSSHRPLQLTALGPSVLPFSAALFLLVCWISVFRNKHSFLILKKKTNFFKFLAWGLEGKGSDETSESLCIPG